MVERAVFINYGGEDSDSYAALLHERLVARLGENLVFLDAEPVSASGESAEELLDWVRSARALLFVIGPRWLTATDPTGQRRIDDPTDWVGRELAAAFAAGVPVIPVLTGEAERPAETDLPADIAALSRCQFRRLRRHKITADLPRILSDLTRLDPDLAEAMLPVAATTSARDKMSEATSSARRISPTTPKPPPLQSLDEHVRRLAIASRVQWTAEAFDRRLVHPGPLPIRWHRSTAPVAGPASGYVRFSPLPGLPVITSGEIREGDRGALHTVYGGLPSGRLLVLGNPGSGKSAAAILLLLDALKYREQAPPEEQTRIPVPVLFTLHGWHPDRGESVVHWIVGKLAETYPTFHGRAGRRAATDLLAAGRVAVFLDGLDEIPELMWPQVLAALADAPFRLVLLARTAEAVAAAAHGPLPGALAVELQPVVPANAATYLLQSLIHPPPAPWQNISDHLAALAQDRQTAPSAVSEALTTPLSLSLLRDVYGPAGQVDELLDTVRFPTAADVDNHLLDGAIVAAYRPRPGHPAPRYSVATALHTLSYLATELTDRHTVDLAWWQVPSWGARGSRIVSLTVMVLTFALVFGLPLGLLFGFPVGMSAGFASEFMSLSWLATRRWREAPIVPKRIARPTYQSVSHSVVLGLVSGLVGGLLAGLSAVLVSGPPTVIASGLAIGLATGLAGAALFTLVRPFEFDESSSGPTDVWRRDRNAGLLALPLSALIVGLLTMGEIRLLPEPPSGDAIGLLVVLSVVLPVVIALTFAAVWTANRAGTTTSGPGSAVMETAIASIQLRIRHKTPLRLIAFLEDARSRHLLRTVGPVYQFRHVSLQFRLVQHSLAQPSAEPSVEVPSWPELSSWPGGRYRRRLRGMSSGDPRGPRRDDEMVVRNDFSGAPMDLTQFADRHLGARLEEQRRHRPRGDIDEAARFVEIELARLEPMLAARLWYLVDVPDPDDPRVPSRLRRLLVEAGASPDVLARDTMVMVVPHGDGQLYDLVVFDPGQPADNAPIRVPTNMPDLLAQVRAQRPDLRAEDWLPAPRRGPSFDRQWPALLDAAMTQASEIRQYAVLVAPVPELVPATGSGTGCLTVAVNGETVGTVGVAATTARGEPVLTTARHAVTGCESLVISGHPSRVLAEHVIVDCSTLELSPPLMKCVPSPPKRVLTLSPRLHEVATFFGARSGIKQTIVTGFDPVLLFYGSHTAVRVYTNADTAGGDSGAALMDSDGHLMGFCSERTAFNAAVQFTSWIWALQVFDLMEINLAEQENP